MRTDLTTEKRHMRWVVFFHRMTGFLLVLLIAIQTLIDPFDVWQLVRRDGFNARKPTQETVERLFKIYQYEKRPTSVVFIGDSRVFWGLAPKWSGIQTEDIYNFGLGSLQTDEMDALLRFIVGQGKVRHVVIGMGIMPFNLSPWNDRKELHSRLNTINSFFGGAFISKIKETCLSFDAVSKSLATLNTNRHFPTHQDDFNQGWRIMPKNFMPPDRISYKISVWNYVQHFKTVKVFPKQVRAFERLIKFLKQSKIDFEVFFPPMSEDLLMLLHADPALWNEFETAKKRIAEQTAFTDFAYLNSITRNRNAFFDITHFRPKVGEMILETLRKKHPTEEDKTNRGGLGIQVDAKNIDAHLDWVKTHVANKADDRKDFIQVIQKPEKNRNAFLKRVDSVIPLHTDPQK